MANSFDELAKKVADLEGPSHVVDVEIAHALGYRTYAEPARVRMCGGGMLGSVPHKNKVNVPRFTRSIDAAHELGRLTDPDLYVETATAARVQTSLLLGVMHRRGLNPADRGKSWQPKGIVICKKCDGFMQADANYCQRCGHAR